MKNDVTNGTNGVVLGINGAVFGIIVVGLLVGAGAIGWTVGHETSSGASEIQPGVIGDATRGRVLFVSKGCADCHSYLGKGGDDGPALDFMSGRRTPADIANMSGRIWNHLPGMLPHFEEEGIPFPTFAGFEMADLIAYLHSRQGTQPPPVVTSSDGNHDDVPPGG